jgi:hypothetical protein
MFQDRIRRRVPEARGEGAGTGEKKDFQEGGKGVCMWGRRRRRGMIAEVELGRDPDGACMMEVLWKERGRALVDN